MLHRALLQLFVALFLATTVLIWLAEQMTPVAHGAPLVVGTDIAQDATPDAFDSNWRGSPYPWDMLADPTNAPPGRTKQGSGALITLP